MQLRILKVLFSLLLVTNASTDGGLGWSVGPWSPVARASPAGPGREFDRQFRGLDFAFAGPQHLPGSLQKNRAVFVNPFASQFVAAKGMYPLVNQRFNPIKTSTTDINKRYLVPNKFNPKYAPKYTFSHPHNQKYIIPKASKRYPTENRHRLNRNRYKENAASQSATYPHNRLISKNPPIKVFRPYIASNAQINQYNYDPILQKIRSDVNANEIRLKKKEEEPPKRGHEDASEPTDASLIDNLHRNQQNENFQPKYEQYSPQSKPYYYNRPIAQFGNDAHIKKNIRYPRPNFENIKIHRDAYEPLKHQISGLKENQGNTFKDDRNEYPAHKPEDDERAEEQVEPDGYDTFDRQKTVFENQNANFDGSFDEFTREHHPNVKVLPEKQDYSEDTEDTNPDSDDFIPIKMYAQVRHVETERHLPREAAYEDAVTYDDVINAPRLREAIKTTKAQTVYTEEGYEDGAYDHAGHLKHASNHEGHGGYAKDKSKAAGLYKDGDGHHYEDGGRSKNGYDLSKGKKWFVDKGNNEKFENQESFSEKDGNHESSDEDLVEAGSEKSGAENTRFTPKDHSKTKMRKIVTISKVEKKYEDISTKSEKDEVKSAKGKSVPENGKTQFSENKNQNGENLNAPVVGEHLKRALEYNYDPEIRSKVSVSELKKDDQSPEDSDVEVFRADFKMNNGPRHGGNYKQIPNLDKKTKEWVKVGRKSQRTKDKLTRNNEAVLVDKFENEEDTLKKSKYALGDNFSQGKSEIKESNSLGAINQYTPGINLENLKRLRTSKDSIEIFEEVPDQQKHSEKLLQLPIKYENVYSTEEDDEDILKKHTPKKVTKESKYPKSETEVFRSDFEMNRRPKHGGNYVRNPNARGEATVGAGELDDLNSFVDPSEKPLHGGNYRNRPSERKHDTRETDFPSSNSTEL